MKKIYLLALALMISACQSFKEKVGLVKDQPDEYQVISNQPLSVPVDLVTVKSPEELQQSGQDSLQNNKNLSKGENILLQNMKKN